MTDESLLREFMECHQFDVVSWDGETIEGYNVRTGTDGNLFLEPFEQVEYVAGSPIDVDWEDTSAMIDASRGSKSLVVAKTNEALRMWERMQSQ